MSYPANLRQIALLSIIIDGDGYQISVRDNEAAEECVTDEWLCYDGETGYAITMEGVIMMRANCTGAFFKLNTF